MSPWTSGINMNTFDSTSTSLYSAKLSSQAPSKAPLDLLITYIHTVLLCITDNDKDSPSKKFDSGIKLKDLVQPIALDFSNLLEGISQGAEKVSDQKLFTSKLSCEAHTVALDVLKGLGNAHWVAVGLLAIAKVLERFDKISSNDRECVDLLKGMLHLAKFLKQLKDANADLQKEMLEKMYEAVHLIVTGAILCHSFITSNRVSKFILTAKIREELVYLRGKVDSVKSDLSLQMQVMMMSTLIFISRQQLEAPNAGALGGIDSITEEFPLEHPNGDGKDDHSLAIECGRKETPSPEFSGNGKYLHCKERTSMENSSSYQQKEMPPAAFCRIARFLKTSAYGLKKLLNPSKRSSGMKNGACHIH